jgi:hypothetical protein
LDKAEAGRLLIPFDAVQALARCANLPGKSGDARSG